MGDRGKLRVYLGAAPGVGKTYAMLGEGHRRAERGTDVVVGFVETHGRRHTAEMLEGLEVVPRRALDHRGSTFEEMDVDAVLARRPKVALVDELAHTNVPGSRNHKRWQDIEELLGAGIDVITTVNIQHLESVNDVVEKITGVPQRETVPDAVVRAADQVELEDMSAEALRRRLAHGNVYAAEKVDAALSNYFRAGNLNALRELALLWTADRVDDALQQYRETHDITGTWEARERVVVALTGGPEGETLIRRATRIAARSSGGDLLAVHVARSDGLADADQGTLAAQRLLVESLGGTYHQVLGDDVPSALLAFARAENATQLVLGDSRRPSLARIFGPGTAANTIAASGDIDVHIVSHSHTGRSMSLPHGRGSLSTRRKLQGYALALLLPPLLTMALTPFRDELNLVSDMLLFLLLTVVVSLVGGLAPALISAVLGSVLLNYFFTPPFHTLTINETNNTLALLVFVLVATLVSSTVDLAARRTRQAARAAAESRTLANLAGSVLRRRGGPDRDARPGPGDLRPHLRHPAGAHRRRLDERGERGTGGEPTRRGRHGGVGRRPAHPGAAWRAAEGRGPAPDRRLRGPGRRRAGPHPAQPRRRRGSTARRGEQGPRRPAGRRRPRLPHPPRGRQGVRLHPAERRPRPRCRRPARPPAGRGHLPGPAGRPRRQPARHEPPPGRGHVDRRAAHRRRRGRRAGPGRPRGGRTSLRHRCRRRRPARAWPTPGCWSGWWPTSAPTPCATPLPSSRRT